MTHPDYPRLQALASAARTPDDDTAARALAAALTTTRATHPVEQAYLDGAALAARTLTHAGTPDETTRMVGMVEELLAAAETSTASEVFPVEGRVDFQIVGQWLTVRHARAGVDRALEELRDRGEHPEVVQLCRAEDGDVVVEEWRP